MNSGNFFERVRFLHTLFKNVGMCRATHSIHLLFSMAVLIHEIDLCQMLERYNQFNVFWNVYSRVERVYEIVNSQIRHTQRESETQSRPTQSHTLYNTLIRSGKTGRNFKSLGVHTLISHQSFPSCPRWASNVSALSMIFMNPLNSLKSISWPLHEVM